MQKDFWPASRFFTEWREGATWNLLVPITETNLVSFEMGRYGDLNAYQTENHVTFEYEVNLNYELSSYLANIMKNPMQENKNKCCVIRVKKEDILEKTYLLHDIFISACSFDLNKLKIDAVFRDATFI